MRYFVLLIGLSCVTACGSNDDNSSSTTTTAGGSTATAGTTTGGTTATTTTAGTTTSATTVTTTGGTATTTAGGTAATTTGSTQAAIPVSIQGSAFNPANITASVSQPIVFTNNDSFAHTASSTSGTFTFESGNLAQNATFTFTPSVAGNGNYRCNIHPNMLGTIKVNAN